MASKSILITGATSGIGLAGAIEMARRGWRVFLHARSATSGATALARIKSELPQAQVEIVTADLSSKAGVLALAAGVRKHCTKLDVLWNNAGMSTGNRTITPDGWELQMAVNYVAPFLLTRELLPLIQAGGGGRVVSTASMAQAWGRIDFANWMDEGKHYSLMGIYSKTKLCNVLFTRELAARYGDKGIIAQCYHPGWVRSEIGKDRANMGRKTAMDFFSFLQIPAAAGADTGVFLATDPTALRGNGRYWAKRRPRSTNKLDTPENAKLLWELTEKALTMKP